MVTMVLYIYFEAETKILQVVRIIYRYIMFGRGICEKYQLRDEKFPEPKGEGNLVSRLVFFANTPPKHDISV
jgi:hypothetical protein